MTQNLLLGITQKNTAHAPVDPPISVDEMFRRTREAGVFDYFDKTPPEAELSEYQAASEKYGLPVLGCWQLPGFQARGSAAARVPAPPTLAARGRAPRSETRAVAAAGGVPSPLTL